MNINQILILFLCCNFSFLYSNKGSLIGEVIDSDTHAPLVGANIVIENSILGTSCDNNGKFYIDNIPVGSYTVTASMIGYSSVSRANINIYSNRQSPLKFNLVISAIKSEQVIVKSRFFEKAKDAIISTQTIDRGEIRSDPVGAYDIQMMLHSLPSVVGATDQNNEIVVRGGSPNENLFIMDNLEIPNPNHFGEVGTGGGATNIINTEFIERIDFFAGGFPVKYGDKQSSVMDVKLREGNFNNQEINLEMSMAGVGFLFEGPIFNKKASYISSYRKSFVEHIIKSAGLTSVPEYSNTQHKITYNINNRKKIIFNLLGGIDNVSIQDESRPDLKGAENVKYDGYQYAYGFTYKSLFSQRGYFSISFGESLNSWNAKVYKKEFGIVDTFFYRDNIESDKFFKYNIVYKLSSNIEFSAGINTKYGEYKMDEVLDPDTLFIYDYPLLNSEEMLELNNFNDYYDLILEYPEYEGKLDFQNTNNYNFVNTGLINNNSGGIWKHGLYSQLKYKHDYLQFSFGLRYDNVPYNSTSILSPRLGINFILSPLTKLNFAIGQFYQTPNYWILMNPNNSKRIKNSYTHQIILGLEHLFTADTRLTIELYKKNHYNRPIKESDITIDTLDNYLGFTDVGEGNSNGLEIFLQKKFLYNWYATFSYAYSRSKAKDFRRSLNSYYPWDFDSKNSLTIVGGYKFNFKDINWYKNFKNTVGFNFLFWIPIFPADQLEISFRYKYSDGLPYTAKRYDFIHRRWYVHHGEELNGLRNNYYSRFDLMILRRFNFSNFNITTFIDLQNVFNNFNEWERVYLKDGKYEMSYQYKQLPVGGVIIEF